MDDINSTSRNRGKSPNDDLLFGSPKSRLAISEAIKDVNYLLTRGYGVRSAVSLCGNRYRLNARQQKALRGMSVSQDDILERVNKQCNPINLTNKKVDIDGFNLLILLETAYSGGYIFKGSDGAYRDLSGVHGSYKRVKKTKEVLNIVGQYLVSLNTDLVTWYFDTPVSNSGRLKNLLFEVAEETGFNWNIELVYNPDKALADSDHIVISSDAFVLNECKFWFNLAEHLRTKEWTVFETLH